ncbi:MAG: hypothetical protein QOE15_360 [Acidimicrobiaceae bacterium]|nr:hypothetical protein [Acidimicrobiaceae bacterium]
MTYPSGPDPNLGYVDAMALDEGLLAELRTTKAAIDELQGKLKDLVAALREQGASAQEIGDALRG